MGHPWQRPGPSERVRLHRSETNRPWWLVRAVYFHSFLPPVANFYFCALLTWTWKERKEEWNRRFHARSVSARWTICEEAIQNEWISRRLVQQGRGNIISFFRFSFLSFFNLLPDLFCNGYSRLFPMPHLARVRRPSPLPTAMERYSHSLSFIGCLLTSLALIFRLPLSTWPDPRANPRANS